MILRNLHKSRWINQFRYNSTSTYSDKHYHAIISEGYRGVAKLSIPTNVSLKNQMVSTPEDEKLKDIIKTYRAPMVSVFGYGSGVFEQSGYGKEEKRPQIDLICIVEDAEDFHKSNLAQFPEHYSSVKFLSHKTIAYLQNIGVGLYFVPFVMLNEHLVKYGVITLEKTLKDLSEWSSLYLAGRLQKPVKFLNDENSNDHKMIQFLNQYNLKNAMTLALLLMRKDKFTEVELYEAIANISYLGDFRLLIGGENPNKVKNMINKQFDSFRELYDPILDYFINNKFVTVIKNDDGVRVFVKEIKPDKKAFLISKLPYKFREKLYEVYGDKSIKEIARDPKLDVNIIKVIKRIVRMPSFIQMLKGIPTAGIIKSLKYALEKNLKFWRGGR